MKRLALALFSFILPLSAQKTVVEIPENMVRTEPITENLANMKLSFGASPGPVVRPTEVKNDFLLSYKGVAIGDEVAIDKKTCLLPKFEELSPWAATPPSTKRPATS